jgi:hypothetical protein
LTKKINYHSYYLVTMSFEKTTVSGGNKYRLLVESKWDIEKKQYRIHVIKHLGKIAEKDDKET